MKTFEIGSVLAPTDLSDSSVPAMRYALMIANAFEAKLTVMYSDPIIYPVSVIGGGEGLYVTTTPEYQAQMRADVRQHADKVMLDRPYGIDVSVGQPALAVLSTAKKLDADIIVMGSHLRHGWRRALLGSVSEGVVHGSHCPVLTVASHDHPPRTEPHRITNVMCPVNFTDVARESVRVAGRLAKSFNAKLTLVHVIERDDIVDSADDEAKIRAWVAPELQGSCEVRELVVRGGAAERVLDCAEDLGADLLVIGAQHKMFRDATVIGTTTERIMRFASCPVLVVPREVARRRNSDKVEEEVAAV